MLELFYTCSVYKHKVYLSKNYSKIYTSIHIHRKYPVNTYTSVNIQHIKLIRGCLAQNELNVLNSVCYSCNSFNNGCGHLNKN